MSNSEDRDTPVEDNKQERDGSEATSPRKRNGYSANGDDGPNSKKFRIKKKKSISGVYHKIWLVTQMTIRRNIYQKKMSKKQF